MDFFKENRVYALKTSHPKFQEFVDFAKSNALIAEVLKSKVFTMVLNHTKNVVTHISFAELGKLLPPVTPSTVIPDYTDCNWFYRIDFRVEGEVFDDVTHLYPHLVEKDEEKELETASEYKYVVVGFLRNGTKYTGRIKNTLEKAEEEANNLSFSNPQSVYFVSKLQTRYQYKLNKTEV
ncbi:hypothetical protein fHeYen901_227 [Yersinia phage fHe-Yen9-01]|uniref:Uncharacterized protein n=1 Tax=Yersinia phage fHe-Yen9-01 TaxID=1965363 RepID=A0A1V0DXY4_9CAUD|nr:hypothetical protein KNT60_gp226 [Yersinia phage fHe-Yen9-01]ARB06000.1 hypothetical protein fHeYen901_227 [Yersinia phage fHe-Yen9-01]